MSAPRPLVEATGLTKHFVPRGGAWSGSKLRVQAVAGVDLRIDAGETLGLVGESGSGKSTLGRMLIRLIDPDGGRLAFDGIDLLALKPRELRPLRRRFQMVFQDAYGSLNPRMRIGATVAEPLVVHRLGDRTQRRRRVAELLDQVGLDPRDADKYPHEFSGGQRQRIGIARAIASGPDFVVADEPVSALDPPVQAQILELMDDLRRRHTMALLFIAHDLRAVRRISDRVAVMYLGRIVEHGPAERVYAEPLHPYTKALLASTPRRRPGRPTPPALVGEQPSASRPPAGCRFHPRCPLAEERCRREDPVLVSHGPAGAVACHLVQPPPPADR